MAGWGEDTYSQRDETNEWCQATSHLTLFASPQTQTAFQIRAGEFRTGGGEGAVLVLLTRRDISPVDKNIDKFFINWSTTEDLKETILWGRNVVISPPSSHSVRSCKFYQVNSWPCWPCFIGQLQTGCCCPPPPRPAPRPAGGRERLQSSTRWSWLGLSARGKDSPGYQPPTRPSSQH